MSNASKANAAHPRGSSGSGRPSRRASAAAGRAHAALSRYLEAQDRLQEVQASPDASGEYAEVEARALDDHAAAEDAVIEAVRRATPGGGDRHHCHALSHDDACLYVTLPDGKDLEIDGQICRILAIPPSRQCGAVLV